jgi:hypothetical protein
MLTIDEKSPKNENLAIWLNPLKLGNLQHHRVKRPWGKKTTGYSIPQGKTKSTKTISSGWVWSGTIRSGQQNSAQCTFVFAFLQNAIEQT